MTDVKEEKKKKEVKRKLYNVVDRKQLLARIKNLPPYETGSFYKYFFVEDCYELRNLLYQRFDDLKMFGRVYVATEGVNAQISFPAGTKYLVKKALVGTKLEGCLLNVGVENPGHSFYRLVVKVRRKIVDDGMPMVPLEKRGKELGADEFNKKIAEEGTAVFDVRNSYEYEVGHFENAIGFKAEFFRDQLPELEEKAKKLKPKQIIMYCTGGIRCEKASAYLINRGFQNVHMLYGGVVNYAQTVKKNNLANKFIGKNFTFDMRLGEKITEEIISVCHQCGKKCNTHTNCGNILCNLLFLQCEECSKKFSDCCSHRCAEIKQLPKEEQKKLQPQFVGAAKKNIYNAYKTGKLQLLETS